MVTPPMLTSSEPVISNPRDVSPQSKTVLAAPVTEAMDTAPDEPSVEPHDVVCVPGKSKTVRVAEVDVAASADDTESHGVARAPHVVADEADDAAETRSASRASSMGTVVGDDELLAVVNVAALTRYTIVDGFVTPVKT